MLRAPAVHGVSSLEENNNCGTKSNILFQSTILEASILKLDEIFDCFRVFWRRVQLGRRTPKKFMFIYVLERKVSIGR